MGNDEKTPAAKLASLSVFFPCYNEVGNIDRLVRRTLEVAPRVADEYEIIIVDDGSVDGTGDLADRLASETPQVRAIHHETNQGYGRALRSGFEASRYEYIFFTDGDAQFDVGEITRLIDLLPTTDIAIGWRVERADSLIRVLNAKAYMWMIRLLFGLKAHDIDCAFKLIPRRVIQGMQLRSTGALISAELLIKATQAGHRFSQVGVNHYPRLAGRQSGASPAVVLRMFRELWRLRGELRGPCTT